VDQHHLVGDVVSVIATRGAKGAQQVLGTVVKSIVGSDRWSGYNWLDSQQRQLYRAHLKRDFQALVERGGASEWIGRALLEQVEKMFGLWHRVRDGTLSRADFQTAMQPIQTRVGDPLREGAALACDKTRHTCENLKLEVALWTFVRVEGVEPTNNSAERGLRRAVLWRWRSFGAQSEDDSHFVERVLTAVTTLRQQKRDVLDYLTVACAAAIRDDQAPSLLPNTLVIQSGV
jgi:transposase